MKTLALADERHQGRDNNEVSDHCLKSVKDAVLDAALDCIIFMNQNGEIIEFNRAAEKTFGYNRTEIIGRKLEEMIIPPSLRKEHTRGLKHYLSTGEGPVLNKRVEVTGMRAGGDEFPVELAITSVKLEGREVFAAYLRDIGEAKRSREALEESKKFLTNLLDSIHVGVMLIDPDEHRIIDINSFASSMIGIPKSEIIGHECHAFVCTAQKGRCPITDLKQRIEVAEKVLINSRGENVPILKSVSIIERNGREYIIESFIDITDLKKAQEQLLRDALYDKLTGLPNRALLVDRLNQAVKRAFRYEKYMFAVLYLNLDRFKTLNESFGHKAGDQLIIQSAKRIKSCLRKSDTLSRHGGDGFSIFLNYVKEGRDAIRIAERVQEELRKPFNLMGHEFFTGAKIGIALSSTGYKRPEDILRDARTAMHWAGDPYKGPHVVFDRNMHEKAINRLHLENDLRQAIKRQEFVTYYQPIVSLKTRKIIGFEALIRWQHPERGLVSPMEFIPVAEESDIIITIGLWILHDACSQMLKWQDEFKSDTPIYISVNLSGRQFYQRDLVNRIGEVLRETGLSGNSLMLELTESMVMGNPKDIIEVLENLKNLGVILAIDDFGTGYSSLSYLHRFPVDILKIDQSFVQAMDTEKKNVDIVRTITELARNLGIKAIAEGIETIEHLSLLRELKCENGQGYFFAKPLNSESARELITSKPQWQ